MSTPRRAIKRTPQTVAPKPFTVDAFLSRFQQFIANKNMIASLTERNDGTKQDKTLGVKYGLLEDVKANGDRDPETGSYFLDFPAPVEIDGTKWGGFKAERRVSKSLDVDKAREVLEEKGLLADVEKHVVVLTMDAEVAAEIAQYLDDNGLVDIVTSSEVALSEDDLLQCHYRDQKNFTAKELDGLYKVTETFAAVPQKA